MVTRVERDCAVCSEKCLRCEVRVVITQRSCCIKSADCTNCLIAASILVSDVKIALCVHCICCSRDDRHDANELTLLVFAVLVFLDAVVRVESYVCDQERVVRDLSFICAVLIYS